MAFHCQYADSPEPTSVNNSRVRPLWATVRRKKTYFGFKGMLLSNAMGVVIDVGLVPANVDELGGFTDTSALVSTGVFMDLKVLLQQYWPFLVLVLWFSYKWWNSKKVLAMLPELKKNGATLVDVRSASEFAQASAPGSINIPLQELGSRLGEIPKTAPVVVCCASGSRSGMARLMLKRQGYQNVHNIGTWRKLLHLSSTRLHGSFFGK